jgi:hypothetical protein
MSALDDGFAQVSFCLFSQAKKNKTTSLTDKLTNRSPEKKKPVSAFILFVEGPKISQAYALFSNSRILINGQRKKLISHTQNCHLQKVYYSR